MAKGVLLNFGRSLLLSTLAFSTAAAAIEIGELRDGAWAAMQPPDNRFNDSNSLIVEADDFVIVVDAQEKLEQQLPAAREQLLSGMKLDGSRFSNEEFAAQTARVERGGDWLDENRNVTFTGPTVTIDKLVRYFESLTGQVAKLAADGMGPEQIRESTNLEASRSLLAGDDAAAARFFDRVQGEAIDRAYAELTVNE